MAPDKQILATAVHAAHATTGLAIHVDARKARTFLRVETAKTEHQFLADVKTVDRFVTPGLVKARGPARILVAPYITRETAAHCRQLKLPFLDTAGNAYIEGDGLLIYVVGQERPPQPAQANFRARRPVGLQLTFALLCRPDLLATNYRTMAAAAKVALGTVGPVIQDLRARKLLQAAPDGHLRIGDRQRLLEEWVTRYPTTLRPKLEARHFDADSKVLERIDLKRYHAVWGGEPGADRLTHMLRPAEYTIYTAGPWTKLAAAGRMRANPKGNVEILGAFWDFAVDGVEEDVAPPLLIYADLLATHDGRNVEIANRIREQYLQTAD
jgi:hypothetical protein